MATLVNQLNFKVKKQNKLLSTIITFVNQIVFVRILHTDNHEYDANLNN